MTEELGAGERPLVGARFPHQRRERSEPTAAGRSRFATVRRGYAPEEVDAALDAAAAEIERLRAALHDAERDRDGARRLVRRLEEETARLRERPTEPWPAAPRAAAPWAPDPRPAPPRVPEPRPAPGPPAAEHDPVAERVLRLQRHEALLLRASARRGAVRAQRDGDG